MKERILKIMEKERVNPAKLADKIGVQRSSISHILSGRNKPSLDFVMKVLENYDNLNTDWLLFGIGRMYKEKKNESKQPENITQGKNAQLPLPLPPIPTANHKKIEKIVVFYSDRTFIDYSPE